MKEQSASTLSRRNALKKVSLTAGLALAGSGTTSAKSTSSTTVHFVEMGIEHDLTLPDGRDYIYPYVGNDEYREYTIDTERGVLRVKDTARNGVRSVFQKHSRVVKRIGYRPFPAVVYGAQSERWLTTKLDPATLRKPSN